ncbi:MAG: sigma-54-dependent Fis family transcriptional regulator, partial [Lentisphaerae bacterium]|nr:sigma-54-dependent Fis family transcriptional regulator [Lentisphaerota bacterium]
MTAFSSRDTALEAVKRGAYDFFPKPFKVSEMRIVIRRALERVELTEEIDKLKRELHNREKFTALVGQGEPFLDMLSRLEKVAPIPSTVLIVGESGTGKELVAEAIHDNSTRAGKPLVKINCAAIPATLLESELFGYKKGAFTHATSDREGKFQAAHTGTLVLDEMGDLSLDLQAKLLRALEQQEVQRVGSAVPEQVDV